jgi:hypothetical protein
VAGADTQVVTSSVEFTHTHTFKLPTADVEAFPAVARTYTTTSTLDHLHTVTLSPEDFTALKRGEHVVVQSTGASLPEPHPHAFDVVDQLGQWGAPVLVPSSAWGQVPAGGRTNIEIYNMPVALLSQKLPLVPLPGISLSLYSYVAQLKEDPNVPRFYPDTSDNQPAFILARNTAFDPYFSRAFCGFDPALLEQLSHEQLAQFVLVRHFRLGAGAN